MGRILKSHDIIYYSETVAQKLGLKLPPDYILQKSIEAIIPIPIILSNSKYQMWIDRYYIAYSKFDEEQIYYVYLTEEHIFEEYDSYRRARARGNKVYLPKNIKKAFIGARNIMRSSGKSYCLNKNFFK